MWCGAMRSGAQIPNTNLNHSQTFICMVLTLKFPSKSFSSGLARALCICPSYFNYWFQLKDRQDDAFIRLIVAYLFGKWNFSPRKSLEVCVWEREREKLREFIFCLFSNVNVKGWSLMLHTNHVCTYLTKGKNALCSSHIHSYREVCLLPKFLRLNYLD